MLLSTVDLAGQCTPGTSPKPQNPGCSPSMEQGHTETRGLGSHHLKGAGQLLDRRDVKGFYTGKKFYAFEHWFPLCGRKTSSQRLGIKHSWWTACLACAWPCAGSLIKWTCWHTPVILAPLSSRQEDQKFRVILSYITRSRPAWAT